jgi:hypothetical protein
MKSFGMKMAIMCLTLFLLVSCGGGGGGPVPDLTAGLVWIIVDPWYGSVGTGATKQFTATGYYADGTTKDLTSLAAWTSSNTSYATVDNKGLATGVATGSCSITATYGAESDYGSLTVTAPVVTLVSIAITPDSATVQETATTQFTATGTYSDASTQNLTTSATWTSSNSTIAFVSTNYGTKGLTTGMAVGGPVTISAIYSGKTGTASLTVIPRRPDLSVRITSVISSGTNTVRVSYIAENTGLADASAFYVDVWPNLATPPVIGSTSSARNIYAGLVVGSSVTGTVTLASALTTGTAYAIVDTANAMTESDETDNVSAGYTWPFAGYSCANVTNYFGGFCTDIANGFELTAPAGGSLTFGGYGFDDYPYTYSIGVRNTCSLALFGNGGVVTLEPTTSSSQVSNGPYQTHWAGDTYACSSGYGSALISAGSGINWLSYPTGYNCNDTDTDAGMTKLTCVYPLVPTAPLITYDFDDGLVPGNFTFSGNANWSPYATDLSFRSGVITHNQTSCFAVSQASASGVSFDLKVESESCCDKLKLYVDGTWINSWTNNTWATSVTYSQALGTHEYKWCYEKDGSVNTGADAAWVDNINIY